MFTSTRPVPWEFEELDSGFDEAPCSLFLPTQIEGSNEKDQRYCNFFGALVGHSSNWPKSPYATSLVFSTFTML